MKKSTDVLDLTVITLAEGKNVGKIKEVVVDTEKRALAGFLIQSGDWYKINGLPYASVQSIGEDAIIIENAEAVIDASMIEQMDTLLSKHVAMKDCTIFTKTGRAIGTVSEILFDPESGNLESLQIQTTNNGPNEIPIDAVITFGQNILIIDEDKKKVKSLIETAPAEEVVEEISHEDEPGQPEAQPEDEQQAEEAAVIESETEDTPSGSPEDEIDMFSDSVEPGPAEEDVPETSEIGEIQPENDEDVTDAEITTEDQAEEDEAGSASGDEDTLAQEPETESAAVTEENEPVSDVATATEEQADGENDEEDSSVGDIFANRQAQLLLGKQLIRDIVTDSGEKIALEGDIVDDAIVKNAIKSKKLVQLMVSVQAKN